MSKVNSARVMYRNSLGSKIFKPEVDLAEQFKSMRTGRHTDVDARAHLLGEPMKIVFTGSPKRNRFEFQFSYLSLVAVTTRTSFISRKFVFVLYVLRLRVPMY